MADPQRLFTACDVYERRFAGACHAQQRDENFAVISWLGLL